MAFTRILVDGYSVLHGCPELAGPKAPHSAAARHELIHWLTQYQDASGIPISVFFDGPAAASPTPTDPAAIEVIYSGKGRTADDLIERVVHRLLPYGEVLVVTDDRLERDTVVSMGAMSSSCANFFRTVGAVLDEVRSDLVRHNRKELSRFQVTGGPAPKKQPVSARPTAKKSSLRGPRK